MSLLKGIKKEFKNIFNSETKTQQPTTPQNKTHENSSLKTITHKIAGVTYYKDNILSFATKNPQYSFTKKEMINSDLCNVYEYNFKTGITELIPEPTNPYDQNAIKVLIDGKHVGYIKKGSCKHILNLINQNRIANIESKISGGKYKTLSCNDEGLLVLERGNKEYSVQVMITEQ